MQTVMALEDIKDTLVQLIERLSPGDEVILTRDKQPVGRLLRTGTARKPRKAGSAKGKLILLREDDEHLQDFAEYMP
jgi:antitoxin (DNA-binding transcriptional repressor) of toxin-antitoxin stability system